MVTTVMQSVKGDCVLTGTVSQVTLAVMQASKLVSCYKDLPSRRLTGLSPTTARGLSMTW